MPTFDPELEPAPRTPLLRRLASPLAAACVATAMYLFLSPSGSVEGTVRYDGAPLTFGEVHFHPVGPGRVAIGKIDDQGHYVASTEGLDGLEAGEYIITFDEGEGFGKIIIADKYRDPATSPLHATVHSGHNQVDFDLPKPK